MKTTRAASLAGMAMVVGLAGTVQAGHREWETAGKILSGVMIGDVIRDTCLPRFTPRVEVRTEPNYRYAPSGRCYEPPRCEPRPARWCPPPRVERVTPCRAPIILNVEEGRRLYQPPERGHVAYVQVWSSFNGQWITIAEYPSIW